MKKLLIGILVIIPIIILLVVALTINILYTNAHIAVEELTFKKLNSSSEVFDLTLNLGDVDSQTGLIDFADYIWVDVYPHYANEYTLEWRIAGNVIYTDEEYERNYNNYLNEREDLRKTLATQVENAQGDSNNVDEDYQEAYSVAFAKYYFDTSMVVEYMLDMLLEKLYPAVSIVDDNNEEVNISTTGKIQVRSYCNFTIEVAAENVTKTMSVSVVGYDVEQVKLSRADGKEDNTLDIGSSIRLSPYYTPIDSIVNKTEWSSSDENVAVVDGNGVVKAVGEGNATIYLKAYKYSSKDSAEEEFVTGEYSISVKSSGVSSIFGKKVVTSKPTLTLEEIGLPKGEIPTIEGGELENGIITITSECVRLTYSGGRQFSIESCRNGSIAIANSALFENKENGYILSVEENILSLKVIWEDMLETSEIDESKVTWTSTDDTIATVDKNGNVAGVSDGIVKIIARYDENECSIELNVRKKVSSLQLRTSDESLAIGLAKETVVASERYETSDKSDNTKVANSVYVIVQGQPNTDDEDVLQAFYNAYDFEILSGGEYAYFDDIEVNKLIFKQTLEGKGKQNILVRAKAKYPKYETNTRFTQEDVTITAVYGVEVNDIVDARRAVEDQRIYAMKDGNRIDGELIFEHYNTQNNNDRYYVKSAARSKNLYAITLASSFGYETDNYGNGIEVGRADQLMFYGDVYGNNNILSAKKQQTSYHVLRVQWSGVIISNCIFRANDIGKEGSLTTAEDTTGFDGNVCEVISSAYDENGEGGAHLQDITFEYSIFENAKTGISMFNADVQIKGCIIRNLTKAGLYAPARMLEYEGGYSPLYVHLDLHNVICSNTLGSFMSVAYELYSVKSSSKGRFVEDDIEKNEEYFIENFYNKGINIEVTQTGFLEAYNWQNLDNATLISTGISWADGFIGNAAGQLINRMPFFDDYKYVSEDAKYIHLGFIVSGVEISSGVLDAPNYLKLNMADDRFNEIELAKTIDMTKVKRTDGILYNAAEILTQMTVKMYCYDNECEINPYSTYTVNSALIDRLRT